MTSNINDLGMSHQPPQPGAEASSGKAQTNHTQAESTTGINKSDSITISENADRINQLNLALREAISNTPVSNPEKVEAAKLKVQSLKIAQTLESAERTADAMLKREFELHPRLK